MKNLINKLKGKKSKTFVSLLLLWSFKVSPIKAALTQGVAGFTPTYVCPNRQIYSREDTDLSIRLKENSNNQNILRENRFIYDQRIPEFTFIL